MGTPCLPFKDKVVACFTFVTITFHKPCIPLSRVPFNLIYNQDMTKRVVSKRTRLRVKYHLWLQSLFMSPVSPCALVQLPEYICVHCLVLSFHVLGSSLSVFELCLSLSIWATEFLLSACKVLLCAWSMRSLCPFATSMSFWVCILGPGASFSHFSLSVCYVPVVRLCATSVVVRPCATFVVVGVPNPLALGSGK